MTTRITPKAFVLEVLRLADERPEYVYAKRSEGIGPTCLYIHDRGKPTESGGCIFGQALLNLGHRVPQQREGVLIERLLMGYDCPLTVVPEYALRSAASRVQRAQDRGEAWGEATIHLRHYARKAGWIA